MEGMGLVANRWKASQLAVVVGSGWSMVVNRGWWLALVGGSGWSLVVNGGWWLALVVGSAVEVGSGWLAVVVGSDWS